MMEEKRKQLMINLNPRISTPSIQKTFIINDP